MFGKYRYIPILVLAMFVPSGCDFIYRLLDKEGAEEKALIGEITAFEVNPTIEKVQILLDIYGYSVGKPDGVLGTRTRNAIEKFQIDSGIEPSRFVDNETWEKLKVFANNGFIEDNQLNIKKVQTALNIAGYEAGKVDGKLGAKTEKAILNFQEGHGLKPDGKIGYKTLTALSQYIQ